MTWWSDHSISPFLSYWSKGTYFMMMFKVYLLEAKSLEHAPVHTHNKLLATNFVKVNVSLSRHVLLLNRDLNEAVVEHFYSWIDYTIGRQQLGCGSGQGKRTNGMLVLVHSFPISRTLSYILIKTVKVAVECKVTDAICR